MGRDFLEGDQQYIVRKKGPCSSRSSLSRHTRDWIHVPPAFLAFVLIPILWWGGMEERGSGRDSELR